MEDSNLKYLISKLDKEKSCKFSILEHIQLFNYLKELEMYRKIGTLKECYSKNELKSMKKEAFLTGIQASITIEWTRESEEIERVLSEYGYK